MVRKYVYEKDDSTVFKPNYIYNSPSFLFQLKKETGF